MKTVFLVLAIVGFSQAAVIQPPQTRTLYDDYLDFVALIPVDDITAIVIKHLQDPEVQEVIAFIFSDEFKALVLEVEAIPEYIVVVNYLNDAGLPVHDWINSLHELIGLPPFFPVRSTRTLNDMIEEIRSILPLDELKALYYEKLETSPEFKALVDKLQSKTFKDFIEALKANKTIQDVYARLKEIGIDVDAFLQLLKDFFGFN